MALSSPLRSHVPALAETLLTLCLLVASVAAASVVTDYQWYEHNGVLGNVHTTRRHFALNGTLHGLQEDYFRDGSPQYMVDYVYGKRHGFDKTYLEHRKLKHVAEYVHGHINGTEMTWTKAGILTMRQHWRDGALHGLQQTYFDNDGAPKRVANYIYGQLNGTVTTWHDEKHTQVETHIFYDINGLRHGDAATYAQGGMLTGLTHWSHGKAYGEGRTSEIIEQHRYPYGHYYTQTHTQPCVNGDGDVSNTHYLSEHWSCDPYEDWLKHGKVNDVWECPYGSRHWRTMTTYFNNGTIMDGLQTVYDHSDIACVAAYNQYINGTLTLHTKVANCGDDVTTDEPKASLIDIFISDNGQPQVWLFFVAAAVIGLVYIRRGYRRHEVSEEATKV